MLRAQIYCARDLPGLDRNGRSDRLSPFPSVQSLVSERCSTAFIRFRASNTGIRLDSEVVKATCNPVWGNDTSNLSSSLVDSALVKELEKTKPGREFAVDVPVYPEHIAHQTFEIVFWDKVCLL